MSTARQDPKDDTAAPQPLEGCDTPQKLWRLRCRQWATQAALRHKKKGIWHTVTWAGYYEQARAVGLALVDQGLQPGQSVAILAENRPEWLYADMGAQAMGLIGVGLYPTASAEQVAFILQDSQARVLIVENQEQLDKALAVRAQCPHLQRIVVIDLEGLRKLSDPQVSTWTDFVGRGLALAAQAQQAQSFEAAIEAGQADQIAFLVYTSGTTGQPKGAMVANRNLVFQVASAPQYLRIGPGDRTLSFLPLCHIAERMGTVYNPLALGPIVHFPENSGTVFNDAREVMPHLLFGPPRFWEKMYSQVTLAMKDAVAPARWAYRLVIAEGAALAQERLAGRPVPWWRQGLYKAMASLVFHNLRSFLGLSQVKTALTGAAPVPPDLLKWYMSIGIDLIESYGLTETCGFCTATPVERIKIGAAGVKALGTQVRIGADEEILVRGPNVFAGYWNLPDKTAETIDAQGWLHTGDCGEIDDEGYLRVKDRIKDIIITSGGKNITPSLIENQVKFSPYISDAVVIGEARRFITCLVMIDPDNVAQFAQDRQIPYTDFASLTRAPEVLQLIGAEIEAVNARLARVEQIKQFRVIDQLLTAEDEELTPTMKLKRKVVTAKYAGLIATMYPD
jgi:long-chain acyl-CoA synthetase